jgi:hypothetical protein
VNCWLVRVQGKTGSDIGWGVEVGEDRTVDVMVGEGTGTASV